MPASPPSPSCDLALPRYAAVAAHLHERNGDLAVAARLYAEAARTCPSATT